MCESVPWSLILEKIREIVFCPSSLHGVKGVEREGWFFPAARNPYVYGIQNWLSRGAQEGEKKKELGSAWTLRRQKIIRKRKKEIQFFGF